MAVVTLLLRILRRIYWLIDRAIRHRLGDRTLPPYRPKAVATSDELRKALLKDFLREQPSRFQEAGLAGYLRLKHAAASILKPVYRMVRGR